MIQIDIDMPKYCGDCFVGNKTICRDGCPLKEVEPEKHYDEWCTDCKEYDRERHCCPRWNRVIREALNDAQPEQKKGKWILVSQGVHGGYFECSECGNRALYAEDGVEELSKHCPHCGAKMEEEHGEQ